MYFKSYMQRIIMNIIYYYETHIIYKFILIPYITKL